jgi:hypothetical protein
MAWRKGVAVSAALAGVVALWGATSSAASAGPVVSAKNKTAAFAGYLGSFSPVATSTLTLATRVAHITCTADVDNPDTYFIGLYRGSVASYVSLEAGCVGTTPLYLAGIVTDGTDQDPNGLSLAGGDKLQISVRISATSELVKIVDKTSKQSLSYGGHGFSATHAEILCYGEGQGSFPPFTKVMFSRITLNKAAFKASKPVAYNQVDPSGNIQLSTSHLAKTGKGFTIKYISNQ